MRLIHVLRLDLSTVVPTSLISWAGDAHTEKFLALFSPLHRRLLKATQLAAAYSASNVYQRDQADEVVIDSLNLT